MQILELNKNKRQKTQILELNKNKRQKRQILELSKNKSSKTLIIHCCLSLASVWFCWVFIFSYSGSWIGVCFSLSIIIDIAFPRRRIPLTSIRSGHLTSIWKGHVTSIRYGHLTSRWSVHLTSIRNFIIRSLFPFWFHLMIVLQLYSEYL